jgi:hypothetical protein
LSLLTAKKYCFCPAELTAKWKFTFCISDLIDCVADMQLLVFVIISINLVLASARDPKEWWQSTVVRPEFIAVFRFKTLRSSLSSTRFIRARSKTQTAMASATSRVSKRANVCLQRLNKQFCRNHIEAGASERGWCWCDMAKPNF